MAKILESLDLVILQIEMSQIGRKLEMLNAWNVIVVQVDHGQIAASGHELNAVYQLILEVNMCETIKIVIDSLIWSSFVVARTETGNHIGR